MGKKNKKRQKQWLEEKDKNKRAKRPEDYKSFLVNKHNESFEEYYKAQKIVPEDEWETFLEALRTDLPIAFRISQINGFQDELSARLKSTEFGTPGQRFELNNEKISANSSLNSQNADGEKPTVEGLSKLEWYPDDLGWMVKVSKKNLKKVIGMEKFRDFLVKETAAGNISRQEAVSMLPTLCLDLQPQHLILDMCAAPGSKTAQILDVLHSDTVRGDTPTGFVVANDADPKRAYMLVHQLKRFVSPSFLVVTHEAQHFPTLFRDTGVLDTALLEDTGEEDVPNDDDSKDAIPRGEVIKFDRILCDVPCSGDGTMRKNPMIWKQFDVMSGIVLHPLQVQIAVRGLQMLKVGGLMCYSTCTFNPLEDEAVVADLLRRAEGSVELVDLHQSLPGLKARPAITTWKVKDANAWYDTFDDVAERRYKKIKRSMFPPSSEEVKTMNLHYALRLLPHVQDTGGFFVALLRKTKPTPKRFARSRKEPAEIVQEEKDKEKALVREKEAKEKKEKKEKEKKERIEKEKKEREAAGITESEEKKDENKDDKDMKKKKQRRGGFQEDPFNPISSELFKKLDDEYKLKGIEESNLFSRSALARKIYLLKKDLADLVRSPANHKLKVVHTGVRCFENRNGEDGIHRLCQEGNYYMEKHLGAQQATIGKKDIIALLEKGYLGLHELEAGGVLRASLEGCKEGSVVARLVKEDVPKGGQPMSVCLWMTDKTITCMMQADEKVQYLRYLGIQTTQKAAASGAPKADEKAEVSDAPKAVEE